MAFATNCAAPAKPSNQGSRMYNAFRTFCERLLRIPADPHAPPGDEASTQIYRAAANYYKYRLVVWALTSFIHVLTPLALIIGFVVAGVFRDETGSIWVAAV